MSLRTGFAATLAVAILSTCHAAPTAPTGAAPDARAIESDHAGPVTRDTPFDPAAIQKLFPGSSVHGGRSPKWDLPDELTSWIEVRTAGGTIRLEARADGRIDSVTIRDPAFIGPGGRHVGMGWAEAKFDRTACRPARSMSPYVSQIECMSPRASEITAIFDVPTVAMGGLVRYDAARLGAIRWRPM